MSAQVMMVIIYLGPDSQKTAFVVNKFAVVSFLCVLDAVSKK